MILFLGAELDVLISLSIASNYYDGPACRPIIKETCCSSDDSPYLSATRLGHPVLRSDTLGKGSFVPNDICIGGAGHASFILLTGPNMGGKSTLLRQVCMAVILAQVRIEACNEIFLVAVNHFHFTCIYTARSRRSCRKLWADTCRPHLCSNGSKRSYYGWSEYIPDGTLRNCIDAGETFLEWVEENSLQIIIWIMYLHVYITAMYLVSVVIV